MSLNRDQETPTPEYIAPDPRSILLSRAEACKRLGCSASSYKRLLQRGEIVECLIGKSLCRVQLSVLVEYIERCKDAANRA